MFCVVFRNGCQFACRPINVCYICSKYFWVGTTTVYSLERLHGQSDLQNKVTRETLTKRVHWRYSVSLTRDLSVPVHYDDNAPPYGIGSIRQCRNPSVSPSFFPSVSLARWLHGMLASNYHRRGHMVSPRDTLLRWQCPAESVDASVWCLSVRLSVCLSVWRVFKLTHQKAAPCWNVDVIVCRKTKRWCRWLWNGALCPKKKRHPTMRGQRI